MFEDNDIDTRDYKIVVNHEEQYSIWFSDRELPLGWEVVEIPKKWSESYNSNTKKAEPDSGNKDECLAYIKEIWTDMRPLSLRKKMDGAITNAA